MGYIFEELIRRFSDGAESEDYYIPRDFIKLKVNLLFMNDDDILTKKGITQAIYDCCEGTGGMGSVSQEYLKKLNSNAYLKFYARELNEKSYAICKADILIKGQDENNIAHRNDKFSNMKFNYMISNPSISIIY
ncbi:MAG: N-6 DNA methylase [Clostridium perfringens]|nr:N-6 DNA methylase [Clostridium perfringens]